MAIDLYTPRVRDFALEHLTIGRPLFDVTEKTNDDLKNSDTNHEPDRTERPQGQIKLYEYDSETYAAWGRKRFGDDWYERRKTMLQERHLCSTDEAYKAHQRAVREMERKIEGRPFGSQYGLSINESCIDEARPRQEDEEGDSKLASQEWEEVPKLQWTDSELVTIATTAPSTESAGMQQRASQSDKRKKDVFRKTRSGRIIQINARRSHNVSGRNSRSRPTWSPKQSKGAHDVLERSSDSTTT